MLKPTGNFLGKKSKLLSKTYNKTIQQEAGGSMHFITISVLLFANICLAKLTPFVPKSEISNLKAFIGKKNIYYYQNSKGEFIINRGLKSSSLISSDNDHVHYNALISTDSKYLVIEQVELFFSDLNLRKRNNIFIHQTDTDLAQEISKGSSPMFHDTWISYFDPIEKLIYLREIKSKEGISLLINNQKNPYYVPKRAKTLTDFYYTQIDPSGVEEIIKINLQNKKKELFFRPSDNKFNLNICSNEGRFYFSSGNFLYFNSQKKLEFSGTQYGDILCHDSGVYFVTKTATNNKETPYLNNIYLYDTNQKKAEILGSADQQIALFTQGESVFATYDGLYKIVTRQ
jgi:hypothetical protein